MEGSSSTVRSAAAHCNCAAGLPCFTCILWQLFPSLPLSRYVGLRQLSKHFQILCAVLANKQHCNTCGLFSCSLPDCVLLTSNRTYAMLLMQCQHLPLDLLCVCSGCCMTCMVVPDLELGELKLSDRQRSILAAQKSLFWLRASLYTLVCRPGNCIASPLVTW
jgi:hypothetical protein